MLSIWFSPKICLVKTYKLTENKYTKDICFFSVKDRNLFHRVNTISNIFPRGCATCENITNGVHSMK